MGIEIAANIDIAKPNLGQKFSQMLSPHFFIEAKQRVTGESGLAVQTRTPMMSARKLGMRASQTLPPVCVALKAATKPPTKRAIKGPHFSQQLHQQTFRILAVPVLNFFGPSTALAGGGAAAAWTAAAPAAGVLALFATTAALAKVADEPATMALVPTSVDEVSSRFCRDSDFPPSGDSHTGRSLNLRSPLHLKDPSRPADG
mmetsp:Transcript_57332/g.125567  ORF Transcript_57332/g.125567 Transcript_57332/m.125567 type:complete len:202 (+) Transcript_57332:468-1073(+)